MRKLWMAIFTVAAGIAVAAAWNCRYQLYGWFPSTPSTELSLNNGVMVDKNGKPFTGRSRTQDDDGFSVYTYKDGKLDGLNVVFTNGRLREIGYWKDDLQNGLFEGYAESGTLVDHGMFRDGVRDGETIQYWADSGHIKVKVHYRAGAFDGVAEQYYPSGTLQFRHHYVDNQLHGEALDYFENGKLRSKVTFENGVQSGPFCLYSEDGTLLEEGSLKNGARHGSFTVYSPQTGKPAQQGNYNMNRYEGEVTTWRPDGTKIVQTYTDGVENGWQKTYNDSGALVSEMMIENGRANGVFRNYDGNGNVIEEGVHEDKQVVEPQEIFPSRSPTKKKIAK